MAKQQQQQKVGKGKVTAVQVAFMVEQYLAENKYTNALAAFRSDAGDLFAKMKAKTKKEKEKEQKLLGLREILDEYISLKEQKLLLQRDRMRLDNAMLAFHHLFRTYYSDTTSSSAASDPSSSSPPHLILPLFAASNPLPSQPPIPPPAITTPSAYSTPITNSSAHHIHNKRKASRSLPRTLPALKKPCPAAPSSLPSTSKIVAPTSNMQQKVQLVNNPIAKSLFKPTPPIPNASPETPQPNKLIAPLENPPSNKPNSTCSVVSSERIIVSPLKGGAAFYSVERSYQFTSPLTPDGRKSGKRDHVKGKLNFDNTDVNAGPAEATIAPNASSSPSTYSPSSSSDGGDNVITQVTDSFDFDFSDFDILNGDFSFSELLVDLDLDCDVVHSQSSPEQTNPTPRLNSEVEGGAHIISPDSSKLPVLDSPDASVQGAHESVTSFRAITKRVKIVSPVKAMRKL